MVALGKNAYGTINRLPRHHRSVETPQSIYDTDWTATGTAGRLRGDNADPICVHLRRRDPSPEADYLYSLLGKYPLVVADEVMAKVLYGLPDEAHRRQAW